MPAVTRKGPQMFINNKYRKLYFNIIDSYKNRDLSGEYTESHHIIPKCMGGKNNKDNIVVLTAKAHYVCHHLLTKFTTGSNYYKMLFAFNCFLFGFGNSNKQRESTFKFTSSAYNYAKTKLSEYMKTNSAFKKECGNFGGTYWMKNKTKEEIQAINNKKARHGKDNGFYGKTHTEENKKKAVNTRIEKYGTYHPNPGIVSKEKLEQFSERMKKNNPMSKSIIVNGIEYISISDAARKLDLPYRKLYRLYSKHGSNLTIEVII